MLTPSSPGGAVTVVNAQDTDAEFSVELHFGYATTDAAGQPRVELQDSADSASAAGWIRAYPERFALRAGARRTVRFLAHAPDNLPDGEYWARITVRARPLDDDRTEKVDARVGSDTSSPTVRLVLETATVLPVFYRKGAVTTSLAVDSVTARVDGDSVDVRASLTRLGNAAYLGVAQLSVRDSAGREIGSLQKNLAVYRTASPRWRVPARELGARSNLTVALMITTNRNDVPKNVVLRATPQLRSVRVASEAKSVTRLTTVARHRAR